MTPNRWTLATEAGDIVLPGGPVLVMNARGEVDYQTLGDVACVQGFAPDHDRLAARGLDVTVEIVARDGAPYAAALVHIVKSRVATLNSIAEALGAVPRGALILIDGQKEEGIEAVAKQMRKVFDLDGVLSKAHGKLIWLTRPERLPPDLLDWIAQPLETDSGYITAPGGFSADGPDHGSDLLVGLMPPLKGRVADWGAGWGYVAGEVLAEQDGIETLDLVEADHAMLEAAKANIDDPRATFHWADVTRFQPTAPYDAILSNPPFHTGRRADPSLGRAFIASAARHLKPSGKFLMVANRHLPYEGALKDAFATGRLLGELDGYKIYEAAKPRRAAPS